LEISGKTYSAMAKARQIKILTAWLLLDFGMMNAQTVSSTQVDFSCPGQVTVTYDLNTTQPTDVTLFYSHNKRDWLLATTVTGDLTAQTTGTGKIIVWNSYADNVQFGKFYFKVEVKQVKPECVMINGTCWAMCNVNEPGTFVDKPEDFGMLYQWNSNIGWSSTNPITSTNGSSWNGSWNGNGATEWEMTNNVCPAGYRLPTLTEYQSLVNASSQWTTINGVNGRIFSGDDNTIFLPAVGCRTGSGDGSFIYRVDEFSMYWSSTAFGEGYAHHLSFRSDYVSWGSDICRYGLPIRCVAE
jgi:uncharacterized protein (TIGR02145 family)